MVTDNHYRWDFIGLSTDQKPTPATSEKVVDGSTFYCADNSKLYVYCTDNWYERKALGGGGTTYTAGSGIDITDDTISVDEEVVATLEELNARIAKGTGAPTTATEGVVGGLYEDNTNGKLYICTAITAGTDPDPDTYTWTEVGAGGGSGPTVVQTTGTSTTDVMSQNAVTSMIYKDSGTNDKIVIGTGADVSIQNYNMAIGTNASGNGVQSTAVGYAAKARPSGTALGYNAQAGTTLSQVSSTAIGQSAYGGGDHCTAIGDNSNTINSYSTAVGVNARARSERSLAIGAGATVENSPAMAYSVALGADSQTTRAGEVNVGAGDPVLSTNGFNSSAYRVIGGVYDGQDAHDVVTVEQVNSVIDAINTALTLNIPHIGASS